MKATYSVYDIYNKNEAVYHSRPHQECVDWMREQPEAFTRYYIEVDLLENGMRPVTPKSIKALQAEKDSLEVQLKYAKKLEKLQHDNPMYMLANILHDMGCRHNHTDGCGWFYFDWDKPHPNGPDGLEWSRKEYLDKAKLYADVNIGMDIHDLIKQTLKLNVVLRGF